MKVSYDLSIFSNRQSDGFTVGFIGNQPKLNQTQRLIDLVNFVLPFYQATRKFNAIINKPLVFLTRLQSCELRYKYPSKLTNDGHNIHPY